MDRDAVAQGSQPRGCRDRRHQMHWLVGWVCDSGHGEHRALNGLDKTVVRMQRSSIHAGTVEIEEANTANERGRHDVAIQLH